MNSVVNSDKQYVNNDSSLLKKVETHIKKIKNKKHQTQNADEIIPIKTAPYSWKLDGNKPKQLEIIYLFCIFFFFLGGSY